MSIDANTPDDLSAGDLRTLLATRLRKEVDSASLNPLSFAQQRLWFLDQLQPNSPLYNVTSVLRLTGGLSVGALEQSLNAIVARHDSLRSRFPTEEGEPMQVVDAEPGLELRREDLEAWPPFEREREMRRRIHLEVNRPFNLGTDRLIRATLLQLGAGEHVLILVLHHIVSDEWSLNILFRELGALYRGFVEGSPARLPELPIQYGDYAAWQREWLRGPVYEKQISYWRAHLSGNPPGTELTPDHPRRAAAGSRGACRSRPLGLALSNGLKELANRESATLFMVTLAAFKALLHRYTQQEDIILGTPIAGRNRVETEDLIGFFVNTLPLRTRVSGDRSFVDLLARVREAALGAYSHADLPFEKLVEALHPERSPNETPFVRMMFLLQNGVEQMRLPGLGIEFLDGSTDTAKFDLALGVEDSEQGLIASIEYKTGLFEADTIDRLLQHYESLVQGVVARPDQPIAELPLLGEAERRRLIRSSEAPVVAEPDYACVHQWFEARAGRTPDAVAVVCDEPTMTYGELNARANQLARFLSQSGVAPETPVALLLERTPEMITAILGVLKAGGAYVPLDPAHPKDRLGFMLEDTRAPVLVTTRELLARLPEHSAKVVCLDTDWETIAREPSSNVANRATSGNTAYIIYTSGSTGKPKGVLVTHYNVVRLFQQTEPWYHFDANDVWTLFHSHTFDFSVWEIWGALFYGGRLVIVPYLVSRSPREFYELLAREKVTVLNQTPSAFRQLLWAESAGAPLPLSLRYVIFGGEALELQSLRPWFDRHGDERPLLVNMYGITETTVHVTYRPIRQADLDQGVGSVIGVPIPDLEIYLLDDKLQPVPVGVPGEICVGGGGVARGYLHRPELTSQRFITNPFSSSTAARLYRSGDLARYTSQGELEYLGRMDHQVKIRGFRVELGEIESALNRQPGIRESIVIAADGPGGLKRLVAYLVPSGATLDMAEVRTRLAAELPDHMIPSALVSLPELPLTSNGKVDRRALPAPQAGREESSRPRLAPRNPTETVLVDIWSQFLGRKTISIDDNFFQLGGHSLLATQIAARVSSALNIELPVRAIFESPTVAGLAETASRARPASGSAITRRARGGGAQPALSLLEQLSDEELERLLQHPDLNNAPQ
jgi:amino acid adenylation domain-containing protein